MAVHMTVAPPDGFESWSEEQWDAWLAEHPWEPAERIADRPDWLVFLYVVRVHAVKSQDGLAPFLERLIGEKSFHADEVEPLRDALRDAAAELARVPASKLWTGTQFYSHGDLDRYFADTELRTGKRGTEMFVSDLWTPLLERLFATLERALTQKRGVYFGHL
mgnify:CR=1 FL=1